MNVLRRFVSQLSKFPLAFDSLRWVLEGGFNQHRKLLQSHLADCPQRVLDCGCGTGIYANFFPPDRYVGIDISPTYIARACRRFPSYNFQVGDATELCFDDGFFGEVIVSGVMHHLDDQTAQRVCAELRRVLKADGGLLVWEDVPTRQTTNLIGRLVHWLDMGEHIRTTEAYRQLLAPYFDVQSTSGMRSGWMDYSVFRCSRRECLQSPQNSTRFSQVAQQTTARISVGMNAPNLT